MNNKALFTVLAILPALVGTVWCLHRQHPSKPKRDAVDMGPKRDTVGAMEKAVCMQGLKFIASLRLVYPSSGPAITPMCSVSQLKAFSEGKLAPG